MKLPITWSRIKAILRLHPDAQFKPPAPPPPPEPSALTVERDLPVVPFDGLDAHMRASIGWRLESGRRVKRALVDVLLVDGRASRLLVTAVYTGSAFGGEEGLAMEFTPVIPLRSGPPPRALTGEVALNYGDHHV